MYRVVKNLHTRTTYFVHLTLSLLWTDYSAVWKIILCIVDITVLPNIDFCNVDVVF